MPRVEAKGITKRFGDVVAARDINLTVEDGEYVTILGPSGCGKTTLIKVISGIWEPTEGEIFIDGKRMNGLPTNKRDVGYLFQNIALFPHLTVEENVGYSPFIKGLGDLSGDPRAKKALEFVDLLDRAGHFPSQLSGGDQQKVALARALASGSKLLLLDEPLSALDARVRIDLRLELRRLVKDLGLTALHVTHDQEEAMSISDRIVLMRSGEVIEVMSPEELYYDARTLFSQNFVGESNFIRGSVKSKDEKDMVVRLESGEKLTFPKNGVAVGDPIVVVVRPERLRLRHEATGEHQEIECVIEDEIFMGAFYRYRVRIASGTKVLIDVFSTAHKTFKSGERAFLVFNTAKCRLFPHPKEGIEEALRLE